jgi:hypothetical protein
MLQEYLDNLTSYAETAYAGSVHESEWDDAAVSETSSTTVDEPSVSNDGTDVVLPIISKVSTSTVETAASHRPSETSNPPVEGIDTSRIVLRKSAPTTASPDASRTRSNTSAPAVESVHSNLPRAPDVTAPAVGTVSEMATNPEQLTMPAAQFLSEPLEQEDSQINFEISDTLDAILVESPAQGRAANVALEKLASEEPKSPRRGPNLPRKDLSTVETVLTRPVDNIPSTISGKAGMTSPLLIEETLRSIFTVKALYAYNSEHDYDLKFAEAQIITVTGKGNEDWYIGEYEDATGELQSGLFPVNFVERYEYASPQSTPSAYEAKVGDSVTPSQESLDRCEQIIKQMLGMNGKKASVSVKPDAIRIDLDIDQLGDPLEEALVSRLIKTVSMSKLDRLGIDTPFKFRDRTCYAIHEAIIPLLYWSSNLRKHIQDSTNDFFRSQTARIAQYMEWLDFLLQSGANLTVTRSHRSGGSFTPLEIAINNWEDASEIVEKLLDAGAPIRGQANLRRALDCAPENVKVDVAKFMVSRGIDINVGRHDGFTLLHAQDNHDLIAFLVANGADVDAQKIYPGGHYVPTPLHVAVQNLKPVTIRILREFGANPHIKKNIKCEWMGSFRGLGKAKYEFRLVSPIEMAEQMKMEKTKTRRAILFALQNGATSKRAESTPK